MKHNIIFQAGPEAQAPAGLEAHMKTVITAALNAEKVDVPCEINVLLTDDAGIRRINRSTRDVDRPTDVLSFPMFQLAPGDKPDPQEADPETGLVPLGDMVLSLARARRQARRFGHSLEREVSYLTVHSILHMLGYDHLDEGPQKAQMRAREEAILSRLGIQREERKEEPVMDKTGKKVVLTKIESPEEYKPDVEADLSQALAPLVVAGAVFGTSLAICRHITRRFPFRKG